MIELSIPLLVSVCGLIMTAINVISKVHDVHKQFTGSPFTEVSREIEKECTSSERLEIHIVVNGQAITKIINVDNFNHYRFEEWADSVDDELFSYDLSSSFLYADGVPVVKVWRLDMRFKVESELCQQEIQGLLPF